MECDNEIWRCDASIQYSLLRNVKFKSRRWRDYRMICVLNAPIPEKAGDLVIIVRIETTIEQIDSSITVRTRCEVQFPDKLRSCS